MHKEFVQLLSDKEIHSLVKESNVISPFEQTTIRIPKHISYGLGSANYDARLNTNVKLFKNNIKNIVDPLHFDESICEDIIIKDYIIMPPNSFLLGVTIEYFQMPSNIFALCVGKSTYARCGIIINPTCVSPGMHGHIVLEISNTATVPVKIYAGPKHGICSFLFFKITECAQIYSGRYQSQTCLTTAKSE